MPDNRALHNFLELRAAQLSETAANLAQGDERNGLLRRAIKMEAASLVIDRWMSSPGLRALR
jgi:hypothetical protein